MAGRQVSSFIVSTIRRPRSWLLLGLGYGFYDSAQSRRHLPVGDKAVLVTGCDTGFGHALAKDLAASGIKVFAGCLDENGDGAKQLRQLSGRLKVVQLDVRRAEEISAARERVERELGGRGLWGLVNNAGVCYLADLELTPDTITRRTMEVNVLGTMAVTKAFLPLVREGKGRVVNVSSLAGRVAMEGYGAYSASKAALEAFTDVLRLEMKKWKVSVSCVQPAGYATSAVDPRTVATRKEEIWETLDPESKKVYGRRYYDQLYSNFESSIPQYPAELSPVVEAIKAGLLARRPKARYQCGRGATAIIYIVAMLPVRLADPIVRKMGFGVKEVNTLS